MIGRGRSRKLGNKLKNSTVQNSATETKSSRLGGIRPYIRIFRKIHREQEVVSGTVK